MSILTDKQFLVVAVAGGLALWYAKNKAEQAAGVVVGAIDPTSPENVFYEGANIVFGELNTAWAFDYLYGGLSLINPWASETEKAYARQVYGVGEN